MLSKQSYSKAVFHTPAHLADEAAGLLVASGAIGCAVAGMTKPYARAPRTVALEAYFNRLTSAQLARVRSSLSRAGMLATNSPDGHSTRVRDPGWATMWMERFTPFRIGRRFLIVPPWQRDTKPGRISIAIQPGRVIIRRLRGRCAPLIG
jgi:ribosomal protein L11 methylase PrmA